MKLNMNVIFRCAKCEGFLLATISSKQDPKINGTILDVLPCNQCEEAQQKSIITKKTINNKQNQSLVGNNDCYLP